MAGIEKRSFDSPDEIRTPPKTEVAVVRLGAQTAARLTFQPGWRWSESIKPTVKTDSCQARHVGAIVTGASTSCTPTVPRETPDREMRT
jgi:hypothetical protein